MAKRPAGRVSSAFTKLGNGASALVERYLPDAFISAFVAVVVGSLLVF